jgi:hypothetical protein
MKAESWFLANKLTLHPSKTKYMLFSTANPTKSLYIMGSPIERMHDKGAATGATYNAHSDPLFASINSLKFEDIYTLRLASMASSIIEKRAPRGLATSFRIIEPHENLRNRQSPSLYVPQ